MRSSATRIFVIARSHLTAIVRECDPVTCPKMTSAQPRPRSLPQQVPRPLARATTAAVSCICWSPTCYNVSPRITLPSNSISCRSKKAQGGWLNYGSFQYRCWSFTLIWSQNLDHVTNSVAWWVIISGWQEYCVSAGSLFICIGETWAYLHGTNPI